MSNVANSLITDRTQSDVSEWLALRAKGFASMTAIEKEKWLAGMKGSYNASDLNRITNAMIYLADLYRQYGYTFTYTPINIAHADGTTDTVWRYTDNPTNEQMAELLESLCSFWTAVEKAEMTVVDVWENTGFGYVALDTPISAGEFAGLTAAHGLKTLVVTIASVPLNSVTAVGDGWDATMGENSVIATYTVPQGLYEDLQDALNALVLLCTPDNGIDGVDATVQLSATLRSGAVVSLGSGVVHWSAIINWEAFETYAFTWEDIESRGLTWEQMERLPIPGARG